MKTEEWIAVEKICSSHNLDASFIDSLQQHELIQIATIEQRNCIPTGDLLRLEQMIRLHYDMDINLEGIDAIRHLLQRIEDLQQENASLKSRIYHYENIHAQRPGVSN